MAKLSGQESAPRADICTASVQDARPPECQDGISSINPAGYAEEDAADLAAFCLTCALVYEHPLTWFEVSALLDLQVLWRGRKHMLMALHARGLVTDEQVQRAFDEHPELVGA